MILEETQQRETIIFEFIERAGLDINEHQLHDALVMDMYLPEVLRGKDADEVGGTVILERLKEVDGEGSGLDADMLDGLHANAFFTKDILLAGRVVVGAPDGGAADGGCYREFQETLLQNLPEELR